NSNFWGVEGLQEVNLDSYSQSSAKWAVEVTDAKRMPEIVQRAFRIARSGRPGPVIISLPEDILPVESTMHFGPIVRKPKPAPSQDEVQRIEEILTAAQRPLI